MDTRTKVIVLYGGRSTEHEVSLRSAAFIIKSLDETIYDVCAVGVDKEGRFWPQDINELKANIGNSLPIIKRDGVEREQWLLENFLPMMKNSSSLSPKKSVIFPVIHGTNGEDGTLQGLLDLADIAYVGPDTLASSVSMDKLIAKKIVEATGYPVVPYVHFRQYEWSANQSLYLKEIEKRLKYPVFVKPSSLGSSVGISRARNETGLKEALARAFEVDEKVLVEKAMNIREIEFAALGEYDPEISAAGEVVPFDSFYSYEEKYSEGSRSQVIVPTDLSPEKEREGKLLAKNIFKALQLYGMARIDLFLTKDTHEFFFNEANTIPGFTSISQYPQLWKHAGYDGKTLVGRLVELAISRHQKRSVLCRVKGS